MGRIAKEFEKIYKKSAEDIFYFCELMGFNPTWQQAQILQAVQDGHRYIAVKSGKGPGKTAASVMVGLWRAWRTYNARTVVTAPAMHQCRDVWLKEARLWHDTANPWFSKHVQVSLSNVRMFNKPDWGVLLRTANTKEAAQGLHGRGLTVLIEEASGVERDIVAAFLETLSNEDLLVLMIGNPNSRDCAFFDCFNKNRAMWHTITLNAEDTARDYPHIVSPERNKRIEQEWGRNSIIYKVAVLGEFPDKDATTIMSSEEVEKCTGTTDRMYKFINAERAPEFGGGKAKQIGIDFSRFGGDESPIYRRSGNAIVEQEIFSYTEPLHVLNRAMLMQKEAGWKDKETWYIPDANGMGEGMMVNLYDAGKNVVEFKAQRSAVDDQYEDMISEAWFLFAKLVRAENCYIPKDNQLIAQLSGRRYKFTPKGKLTIESKDDYKKRNDGQSPDRADALVMAFYDQVEAVGHISGKQATTHSVGADLGRTSKAPYGLR